jgi:hypothetical protein
LDEFAGHTVTCLTEKPGFFNTPVKLTDVTTLQGAFHTANTISAKNRRNGKIRSGGLILMKIPNAGKNPLDFPAKTIRIGKSLSHTNGKPVVANSLANP